MLSRPYFVLVFALCLLLSASPVRLLESGGEDDQSLMTRMIEYEYIFKSETVVYEANKRSEGVRRIVEAIIEFKLLHYDEDANILARYSLKKCIRGPCKSVLEEVLVDFSQGGHHLEGLFVVRNESRREQPPEWNILTAIALTIHNPAKSGEGDRQLVNTMFGQCDYRFLRPEDKVFSRTIENCNFNLESNHSLIPGVTFHNYNQHVVFTQNQRVDADIIYIDATEDFSIGSPLHGKWNLHVKSTVFMELNDRKRLYVKEICDPDAFGRDCAVDTFKAQPLGRNWREYPKRMRFRPAQTSVGESTSLNALVEEYRQNLHEQRQRNAKLSATSERTRILNDILHAVLHLANPTQLEHILGNILNRALLKDLLQVFGAAGGAKHCAALRKSLESPMLRPYARIYVNALAHTIRPFASLIDELKDWTGELRTRSANPPLVESLLATLASLANRRCHRDRIAADACDSLKDETTKWLVENLVDRCARESEDNFRCSLLSLNTLINLPIKFSCEYALGFVCARGPSHSRDLQKAALRLLRRCDASHLNGTNIQKLLDVYRNACAHSQSLEESTMALDVLLEVGLLSDLEADGRRIGSHLLRAETATTTGGDFAAAGHLAAEKSAYFYDAIRSLARISPRVDNYWRQLRRNKRFRPNYAQRALNASTAVQRNAFGVLPHKKPTILVGTTKTLFSRNFPKQIEYSLSYLTAGSTKSGEYRLVLGELINFYFTSAFSKPRPSNVLYGLSVLGHAHPVDELQHSQLFRAPEPDDYDGDEENGDDEGDDDDDDGRKKSAAGRREEIRTAQDEFHNVVFRHFDGVIPLLGGLAVKVNVVGAASLAINHTRVENARNEDHDVNVGTSVVLDAQIDLWSVEESLGRVSSKFAANFSADGFLRLHPPTNITEYCTHLGVSDVFVEHVLKHELPPRSSRTRRPRESHGVERRRRILGKCFVPSARVAASRNCIRSL